MALSKWRRLYTRRMELLLLLTCGVILYTCGKWSAQPDITACRITQSTRRADDVIRLTKPRPTNLATREKCRGSFYRELPKNWTVFFTPRSRQQFSLDYPYIHDARDTCRLPVDLLVLVPSSPDSQRKRQAVRQTWGSMVTNKAWPGDAQPMTESIRLVFLLGEIGKKSRNNSVQHWVKTIEEESNTYDDVVQWEGLHDVYFNLTLKVLLGLRWATQFCPGASRVMKADIDTFVHVPRLLHRLHSGPADNTIWGTFFKTAPVHRTEKYAVHRATYPFDKYPPHVKGSMYILSRDVVSRIVELAPYIPYNNMEDVHVTGSLARVLGVCHEGFTSTELSIQSTTPDVCFFMNKTVLGRQSVFPPLTFRIWDTFFNHSLCLKRMVSQQFAKPFALYHINRAFHRRVIPDRCLTVYAQSLCAGEVLKCERLYVIHLHRHIAHTSSNKSPAPEENVLGNRNAFSDVILEVEGKELYANRAVLAHYSPMFDVMFTAGFKEESAQKVPLPGKDYNTMVTFYNVLFPRSVSAKCLINDDNLIPLLTLADEYQTDEIKTKCQSYIGDQLLTYFRNSYRSQKKSVLAQRNAQTEGTLVFGNTKRPAAKKQKNNFVSLAPSFDLSPTEHNPPTTVPANLPGQGITREAMIYKLILYLWGCYDYELPAYRDTILSLIADICTCLNDARLSKHYCCLLRQGKIDLLEALCLKFDGTSV